MDVVWDDREMLIVDTLARHGRMTLCQLEVLLPFGEWDQRVWAGVGRLLHHDVIRAPRCTAHGSGLYARHGGDCVVEVVS